MQQQKISVVVNNFNYERFLARSVDSALQQTYDNKQVVVVDDCSWDNSAAVAKRYEDRAKVILKDKNEGQGAALNTGFEASDGDIVVFLDSDDYLYPHALERIAAHWREGVALMQYRLHLVDAQGAVKDVYPAPEVAFDTGDLAPKLLATGRFQTTVTSGLAVSRSALQEIMPVPAQQFRISADGYIVTLAPLYGDVAAIDECLGAYCQHGGNYTDANATRQIGRRARQRIEHDLHRYEALRSRARALGLSVGDRLGSRDPHHAEERLASLCFEPELHPFRGDTRLRLALDGVSASRQARVSAKRRLLLQLWFLSCGILPRPMARHVAAWKLLAASRPKFVTGAARTLRRAAG